MEKGKTISGKDFLTQARAMRHSDSTFILHHYTFNQKTGQTQGMRKVDRCKLRQALPKEAFKTDQDLYLLYMDEKMPKMCFKKLARYVSFPPNYEMLKIKWL